MKKYENKLLINLKNMYFKILKDLKIYKHQILNNNYFN